MPKSVIECIKDERAGNVGRKQWNARPQSAEEAQQMLAGASRTIDRLLDMLDSIYDGAPTQPMVKAPVRVIILDDIDDSECLDDEDGATEPEDIPGASDDDEEPPK